jgi:hypothetical protein
MTAKSKRVDVPELAFAGPLVSVLSEKYLMETSEAEV